MPSCGTGRLERVLPRHRDSHHVHLARRDDLACSPRRCSASSDFSNLAAMMRRGLFLHRVGVLHHGLPERHHQPADHIADPPGAFLVIAAAHVPWAAAPAPRRAASSSTAWASSSNRIVATVKETLAPDSARVVVSYYHLGRRILSPEVVKQAMTVFVLYVVTYAVGALVGIAHGYDATQSIFESVAMASNGGISSGRVLPGHARVARAVLHAGDVGRPSGVSHVVSRSSSRWW